MFALLYLSLLWPSGGPGDEVSRLVERHRRYLDSIRTLEVEIENQVSTDGGRSWHVASTMTWRKDDSRHRFSKTVFCFSIGPDLIFRTFWQEFYCDANESREVFSWNALPPTDPLSPGNGYGRTGAGIGDAPPWIANQGPPVWLFFSADQMYSLPDLDRLASSRRLLGKVRIGESDLWGIEYTNPEDACITTVYLDPARNYAITRREIRIPSSAALPRGSKSLHRLLESKEVKPGIHFPMHVQSSSSDQPPTMLDIRVLSVKVNEPIREEAFKLDFPQGAKVRNAKTGETYIWGDGAPALTFTDPDKFRQWELAQMGYSPGRTITYFVLINAGFLALIALIVVMRRRYTPKPLAA